MEATLQSIHTFMKEQQDGTAGSGTPGQSVSNGPHSSVGTGSWEDLQGNLKVVAELVARLPGNTPLTPPTPAAPALLSGLSSAFGVLNYLSPQPFPIDTFNLDVSPFHPPPAQIRTSWHTFLLNIDPLVKVLHRSTTERILHKAIRGPASLTDGETAIVFTIYFSSLSTLSDEDAVRCFGIPKRAAQSTFKSAAEHALAKINANGQTDLTSLQAFVLFLSLGRFTDHAPRVWALTGLVRRLDQISAWKSSSPFEQEIRRRLRWELWCLDHRAHEDSGRGAAPTDTGGSPELPLNVRDADLHPSNTTAPKLKPGWTEISFSLVRFDIARTARTIEFLPSVPEKLAMVDECEKRVESSYLRYCDDSEPVHWLARHVSHVLLMELRFKLLRQDRPSNPYFGSFGGTNMPPAQNELFLQAIDIVDTPRRIEAEPQAKRWSWLLVGYMQFWPLSFLLHELRHRHGSQEVERGWDVAERALARRKHDDTSTNMETLRRLMEEACLEKDTRGAAAPSEPESADLYQPLVDLSSIFPTEMHTPILSEPFVEEDLAGQPLGLLENVERNYNELSAPFSYPAHNGVEWDETRLPGDFENESFCFVFDDGDLFLDADADAAAAYVAHPI